MGLITTYELARELRVHPLTIYKMRRAGLIPGIRVGQKSIRFDLDEVLLALRKAGGDVQPTDQVDGKS